MSDVGENPHVQAFATSEQPLDPLNFEPCRGFRDQTVTSYDLLVVSRGAAHLPVYAVGASLDGLNDSEIESVQHDPEILTRCDKAYQLLFNWKLEVRDRAIWVHLVECLKNLRDDSMMGRIKNRLLWLRNPVEELVDSAAFRSAPTTLALSDTCKQLENAELSDLDLLCVSVKAANHTVAVVGACLTLNDELVAQVICDSRIPNRQKRIYRLLLHWDKTGVRSTWSTLVRCLASLEDEMLSKGIRDYMEDKVHCAVIPKSGLVAHFVHPQQETGLAGAQIMPFSGPTPAVSRTQEEEQFVGHPQEESSFDRYHSLLVTSRIVPYQVIPHGSLCEIRREVGMLEKKLNDLQDMLCESLRRNNVSIDRVRQYISSLSVSRNKIIPHFSKHMKEIFDCLSLEELFTCLDRLGAWCILNFLTLEGIICKFASDNCELIEKLRQFEDTISAFKATTTLSEFLEVWSGRRFYDRDSEGHIPVIVKLQTKWRDFTLAKVAEIEGFLANAFELHKSLFQLANAQPGCVAIMWLVPLSVMTAVQKVMKERLPNLWKSNIQELIVGNLLFVVHCDGAPLEPVSYPHLYKYSINHPEKFWGERAKKFLAWDELFTRVMEDDGTRWFTGGKLNVTRSVLDRHVMESPERVALIWEPNEPGKAVHVTYRELYEMTCRVANVLNDHDIAKGDVVTIYMPAMPLTVACMLACARIGAIHSVILPALRDSLLQDRIIRARSKAVITATTARLGNKELHLKSILDAVLEGNEKVQYVFVASSPEDQLRNLLEPSALTTEDPCTPYLKLPRDIDLMKEISKASPECEPVSMESEESLFLIFTSGSSAEPKIITHSQAGYLLYAAVTHKHIFDYQPGDVFACVADVGWVRAHSYVVYGPLCNGATTVLFVSTATYPDPGRYWDMVERLKINQLYVSTSAVKQLMKCDVKHIRDHDLSSLRTIATGGEPLSRGAWRWYHNVVGRMRCTLVDAWWQTETGGINIAPLPVYECSPLKPGFIMKPFFGVQPVIVNDKMEEVECGEQGHLCLKQALPGMGREVDRKRDTFQTTYFDKVTGYYETRDWAYCDSDGDYRITGRASNKVWSRIQGVWLDVPEIECLMTSHPKVKAATLVGTDDSGNSKTFAFVKMNEDVSEKDRRAVIKELKEKLKADEVPQEFAVIDKEPKTQSGKPAYKFLREVVKELERDRDNHPAATEGGAFVEWCLCRSTKP